SNSAALENQTINTVAYPLAKLAGVTDESIADTWTGVAAEWQSAADARTAALARFTVNDFSEPGFQENWEVEGDGIKHGYVNDAAPLVSLDGESLIQQVLPRGYHTHALSSKLSGAVRMPPQEQIPGQFVSLRLQGGEWAGAMVIPQNALQNEPMSFFDPAAPT